MKDEKILYGDLSYELMGAVFEVNRKLGFGFKEKVYQEALAKELSLREIHFERERFARIAYKGFKVGSNFRDFIIEGKIILELKVGSDIYESHLKQLLSYLRVSGFKLGILVVFTPVGVKYKRLVV